MDTGYLCLFLYSRTQDAMDPWPQIRRTLVNKWNDGAREKFWKSRFCLKRNLSNLHKMLLGIWARLNFQTKCNSNCLVKGLDGQVWEVWNLTQTQVWGLDYMRSFVLMSFFSGKTNTRWCYFDFNLFVKGLIHERTQLHKSNEICEQHESQNQGSMCHST